MVRFMLSMHETCPACDDSGHPCDLCKGKGFTETQVDLVQALQQLGLIDAIRAQAEGLQELRDATSPQRQFEVFSALQRRASRESGGFRG